VSDEDLVFPSLSGNVLSPASPPDRDSVPGRRDPVRAHVRAQLARRCHPFLRARADVPRSPGRFRAARAPSPISRAPQSIAPCRGSSPAARRYARAVYGFVSASSSNDANASRRSAIRELFITLSVPGTASTPTRDGKRYRGSSPASAVLVAGPLSQPTRGRRPRESRRRSATRRALHLRGGTRGRALSPAPLPPSPLAKHRTALVHSDPYRGRRLMRPLLPGLRG
jgi:hypothetical protein